MARRWMPVVATVGVAALLAGAAVFTAERAGCAEPGSYVPVPGGVQLIGGCLNSSDLPVAPPPRKQPLPPPKSLLGD
ncbi:MAG: hypothetical protein QOH09_2453 [Pseudonocardiales bacterium]|jgi:hypothetical protein|nr:hypothetical protein [Pseudonocardiales bacterium]MDT7716461.1 hypothetical protein [Pseudonocardiales bacterium]